MSSTQCFEDRKGPSACSASLRPGLERPSNKTDTEPRHCRDLENEAATFRGLVGQDGLYSQLQVVKRVDGKIAAQRDAVQDHTYYRQGRKISGNMQRYYVGSRCHQCLDSFRYSACVLPCIRSSISDCFSR